MYSSSKSGRSEFEQVELHAVVPRIVTDLSGVDDLGVGHQSLNLIGDIANLVVLRCRRC